MTDKTQVDRVPREVIDNQLLVALDDKSKVAILADREDLDFLIHVLETGSFVASIPKRIELLEGLVALRKVAFLT